MLIQPKPFLDKIKLKEGAFGKERRRNMQKMILANAPSFPLTVEYKDIDSAFEEWVDKELDIVYNGVKLPTFKLFSNQRINEYSQSWKHVDNVGNLLLNFKTVTRESNPKKGTNQGDLYNIPGDRFYPMFVIPILQENGQYAYSRYSMKQPYCVDLIYTVSIITNKYNMLNDINALIQDKFKSIDCYIAPNEHYMPMTLESVEDESEYSIDDRKYYSQSFKIKVKAYIIRESDYCVEKVPSRINVRLLGTTNKRHHKVQVSEEYIADDCCLIEELSPYINKQITVCVDFDICDNKVVFNIDTDLEIKEITTTNVCDFCLWINEEKQDFSAEVKIFKGDNVKISVSRKESDKSASIIINGFDFNTIIDSRDTAESALDEVKHSETYYYK